MATTDVTINHVTAPLPPHRVRLPKSQFVMADRVRGAGPGNASTMRAFSARSFPSNRPDSLPRLIFKDLVEFPRDRRRRYAVAYAQQDPSRACVHRGTADARLRNFNVIPFEYEISLRIHLLLYAWIRNIIAYTFIIIYEISLCIHLLL